MHQLKCADVWGGVRSEDVEACSSTVEASLFSVPSSGSEGGDIYYFSVCAADQLTRVAIADVVGHGDTVSAVSRWLLDALRERMNSLDGMGVLHDLNRMAAAHGLGAMTTAAIAGFYRTNSHFYFSYAGHHEMLLLRDGARQWEAIRSGDDREEIANLPLGVLDEMPYDQAEMLLGPGDRVALYTDGIIEAPSASRQLFGLERLLAVLNKNARRTPREIKKATLQAVLAHTGGSLSHDDVTLLIVEMK